MKEAKSVKFNLQQQHQNGHLSPFKLAKLLDPEASWDKVFSVVCVSFVDTVWSLRKCWKWKESLNIAFLVWDSELYDSFVFGF